MPMPLLRLWFCAWWRLQTSAMYCKESLGMGYALTMFSLPLG